VARAERRSTALLVRRLGAAGRGEDNYAAHHRFAAMAGVSSCNGLYCVCAALGRGRRLDSRSWCTKINKANLRWKIRLAPHQPPFGVGMPFGSGVLFPGGLCMRRAKSGAITRSETRRIS
jgi:hypothetical protein